PSTTLFRSLAHRTDHGLVDRVVLDAADEAAVDLEDIQWQMTQVGVGSEAAAEIVQCDLQPLAAQFLDPLCGDAELAQGNHFRHFDAQLARRQAMAPQLDRKSTRLNSSHVKISYAVF